MLPSAAGPGSSRRGRELQLLDPGPERSLGRTPEGCRVCELVVRAGAGPRKVAAGFLSTGALGEVGSRVLQLPDRLGPRVERPLVHASGSATRALRAARTAKVPPIWAGWISPPRTGAPSRGSLVAAHEDPLNAVCAAPRPRPM